MNADPAVAMPVFDADLMLAYMDGETEIAHAMLDELVSDLPAKIRSLEAALGAGELAVARREAHTLKGLAKGGGAQALSALALGIETACREGAGAEALSQFRDLPPLAERVRAEWQRYLLEHLA